MNKFILSLLGLGLSLGSWGQISTKDQNVLDQFKNEIYNHSQLEQLGIELMDGIGPRLVGSPSMTQAHYWALNKFKLWGITANNKTYGTWRAWERGTDQIVMTAPRLQQLEGMQLAFSPATSAEGVDVEIILLPENIKSKVEFEKWLPNVKGKLVMMSQYHYSGRPMSSWEEHATPSSLAKHKERVEKDKKVFNESMNNTGYSHRYTLAEALEKAGAAGIIMSYWSEGYGVQKVFNAQTSNIPVVDISVEDYGMLYRLQKAGFQPKVSIQTSSKIYDDAPTMNTIAFIPGTEKAEEIILISAHLDSWDGATGATDNGTGVITMMEVARVIKKYYPQPKRSIMIALWGSEEQGLNGSRAFVEDYPNIIENLHVVFNQDSGTGRIVGIAGQGFKDAYDYLGRWLENSPKEVTEHIKTNFPGYPGYRGSDHASFVAAGVPAFYLESQHWDYRAYTWHTNRDTYDKIVFDDLKNNVLLISSLIYFASEDPEKASRAKRSLKYNPEKKAMDEWPETRSPHRDSKNYR